MEWSTPGPLKIMIIAKAVLTLSGPMLFEIACESTHVLSKAVTMIIVETMLKLIWTILFETVCKITHDPLQGHPII